MPKDIKYTSTGDIDLSTTDFQIVESTEQHKFVLLLARPGDIRTRPDAGVGVEDFMLRRDRGGKDGGSLSSKIRRQFTKDGMTVRSINPTTWKIDAVYTGTPNTAPLIDKKAGAVDLPVVHKTQGPQSLPALAVQMYGNIDAIPKLIDDNDFVDKVNQPPVYTLNKEVDLGYAILGDVDLAIDTTSELYKSRMIEALREPKANNERQVRVIADADIYEEPDLVIDEIETQPLVAYGFRKLSKNYVGYAVRVRRDSDDAEQDIGFTVEGDFDTVAFSAFVDGGTGYIVRWYDQSGNGNNATQSTMSKQYPIYLSEINTKPAWGNTTLSGATNRYLQLDTEIDTTGGGHAALMVVKNAQSPASGAWGGMIMGREAAAGSSWFWARLNKGAGTSDVYNFYPTSINIYTPVADNVRSMLWTNYWNETTWKLYEDDTELDSQTSITPNLKIDLLLNGYGAVSYGVKGIASGEVIIYGETLSAEDFATIQNNIIDYFSL